MQKGVAWKEMKKFIAKHAVIVDVFLVDGRYDIWGFHMQMELNCQLDINILDLDYIDFRDNYLQTADQYF